MFVYNEIFKCEDEVGQRYSFSTGRYFYNSHKCSLYSIILCLRARIFLGRNITTFVDVEKIHGALGNRVGYHEEAVGESGLRSWMQSW